ncbi:MAG: YggT family protein [Promicromonosporaceae bacterium]|nr:YggT family protein [Promicromonosporaceae bacterium]
MFGPVRFLLSGLGFLLWLFMIALVIRMVFDWIQFFARGWRPKGAVLVAAEAIYTITDPPLKAVRRVIPPLRIGGVGIDLAFLIVFFVVIILSNLLTRF